LVTLSVVVAIVVSYTALRLAGRVAESERSGGRLWLIGGAVSMGIGIWSMHFVGMLAFSVPIPLRYNVLITLASLIIAMLTSGFALGIASRGNLSLKRLTVGSIFMGAGISAMHYTGMAAIQIMPMIVYDPLLVTASIAIAITASFAALWLFFRLRAGQSWLMQWARAGAAIVMGLAIAGMHYTAMAASMLASTSYCYGGAAFDNGWLAVTIGLTALAVLTLTLITTVYDAHLESRTRQDARRLAALNADLQHGKNLLTLATQAAGIACWEYNVSTRETLWTENEIASLRDAGIDIRKQSEALIAMVHPDDALAAHTVINLAVEERRQVCALRVRVLGQNGATIHLQAHARLWCDQDGRLERLLGVCWDVSEHVQEEQRRLQLQLQLRDASRHAGMAEVATGVLHNIGNVLNSLGVSTSLLLSGLRDSRVVNVRRSAELLEELHPLLQSDLRARELPSYLKQLGAHLGEENQKLLREAQAISTHVEHIGKIVVAQQAYARRGGVTEELDVAELVDNAVALNFTVDSDVIIRRQYAPVCRLTADRHKLIQILANLLSNARQALREQEQGQKLLTVSVRAGAADTLLVDVEDSGVGMTPEVLGRLFEFGFTTKKDGHGFGLHASSIIAKEMGGELSAESNGLGRGARFTLRVPLNASKQVQERKTA
jgi:NO-binding membrane sensor protein with MHYT domain